MRYESYQKIQARLDQVSWDHEQVKIELSKYFAITGGSMTSYSNVTGIRNVLSVIFSHTKSETERVDLIRHCNHVFFENPCHQVALTALGERVRSELKNMIDVNEVKKKMRLDSSVSDPSFFFFYYEIPDPALLKITPDCQKVKFITEHRKRLHRLLLSKIPYCSKIEFLTVYTERLDQLQTIEQINALSQSQVGTVNPNVSAYPLWKHQSQSEFIPDLTKRYLLSISNQNDFRTTPRKFEPYLLYFLKRHDCLNKQKYNYFSNDTTLKLIFEFLDFPSTWQEMILFRLFDVKANFLNYRCSMSMYEKSYSYFFSEILRNLIAKKHYALALKLLNKYSPLSFYFSYHEANNTVSSLYSHVDSDLVSDDKSVKASPGENSLTFLKYEAIYTVLDCCFRWFKESSQGLQKTLYQAVFNRCLILFFHEPDAKDDSFYINRLFDIFNKNKLCLHSKVEFIIHMSEHPLALKIKSEDGYNFTPGIAETPNSGLKDGNNFIPAIADTPNSGLSEEDSSNSQISATSDLVTTPVVTTDAQSIYAPSHSDTCHLCSMS